MPPPGFRGGASGMTIVRSDPAAEGGGGSGARSDPGPTRAGGGVSPCAGRAAGGFRSGPAFGAGARGRGSGGRGAGMIVVASSSCELRAGRRGTGEPAGGRGTLAGPAAGRGKGLFGAPPPPSPEPPSFVAIRPSSLRGQRAGVQRGSAVVP